MKAKPVFAEGRCPTKKPEDTCRIDPDICPGDCGDGRKVVFVTTYKEGRDFINETKGAKSRHGRLHDIITTYRKVTGL